MVQSDTWYNRQKVQCFVKSDKRSKRQKVLSDKMFKIFFFFTKNDFLCSWTIKLYLRAFIFRNQHGNKNHISPMLGKTSKDFCRSVVAKCFGCKWFVFVKWQNVLDAKSKGGKMSGWHNVWVTKCWCCKMSRWQNVWLQNVLLSFVGESPLPICTG